MQTNCTQYVVCWNLSLLSQAHSVQSVHCCIYPHACMRRMSSVPARAELLDFTCIVPKSKHQDNAGSTKGFAVKQKLLLQVSDKERQLELDSLFKDVASVLSEKCINPDNNKPYTISMLERALKDVHFSVDLHRNAKQQALEVTVRTLTHHTATTHCSDA